MTLANYCHKKGFTKDQYLTLKTNITSICNALIMQIPPSKKGNGMYYDINDLLPYNTDRELRVYYIQELKNQGIEMIENDNLWRY